MEIRDEIQLAQLQAVVNAHCQNCETFKKSLMWAVGIALVIYTSSFGYLVRRIDLNSDLVVSLSQKVDYLERSGLVERTSVSEQIGRVAANIMERRNEDKSRMDEMAKKLDDMHNFLQSSPVRR